MILWDPIPYDDRKKPALVADYIKRHIPCPDRGYHTTSLQTRDEVFEQLQQQQVPAPVIIHAMRSVFGDPIDVAAKPPDQAQARIGKPSPAAESYDATMAWYEQRFIAAQIAGDPDAMHEILQMVVELLYYLARGQIPQKDFQRARRAMRANAPSISAEVQHLTREQLRRLRAAPSPRGLRELNVRLDRNQYRRTRRRAR